MADVYRSTYFSISAFVLYKVIHSSKESLTNLPLLAIRFFVVAAVFSATNPFEFKKKNLSRIKPI